MGKWVSEIHSIDKNGNKQFLASYVGIMPKKALINYVYQYIYKDFNTWRYSDLIDLDGIFPSQLFMNRYYYETDDCILCSHEKGGF